jgi:hypothetical protein
MQAAEHGGALTTNRYEPAVIIEGERTRSPHPLIARVPLPCSFLFPLLISLLLFPLLDTPLSPVFALFLIHLLLVW